MYRLLDTPAERERNGSQYALHAVETAQLFCGNLLSFYGTVMLHCTGKKKESIHQLLNAGYNRKMYIIWTVLYDLIFGYVQ